MRLVIIILLIMGPQRCVRLTFRRYYKSLSRIPVTGSILARLLDCFEIAGMPVAYSD